jgi:mono/diheme cytochrome c family protein
MSCAGCHPDGRDDGHVWHEAELARDPHGVANFRAGPALARGDFDKPIHGFARQTPMLAGRVDADGPYGWHGESAKLVDRVRAGFGLHRAGKLSTDGTTLRTRAEPLVAYLRQGLVPPPREARALTAEEAEGKRLFDSPGTGCASCHFPETGFTDRSRAWIHGMKTLPLYDTDPLPSYRVPSLLGVGGTPPYYHDGSAATLEELIENDHDRMGRTNHLSAAERAALVAYLRTL